MLVMDTKLVVHAGTEIIVIGGMFIYFNKKINIINDKLDKMEKNINYLANVLQAHDRILDSNNQRPQPQHTPPPKARNKIFDLKELDKELINELEGDQPTPKTPEEQVKPEFNIGDRVEVKETD
mgnify:FL=1